MLVTGTFCSKRGLKKLNSMLIGRHIYSVARPYLQTLNISRFMIIHETTAELEKLIGPLIASAERKISNLRE